MPWLILVVAGLTCHFVGFLTRRLKWAMAPPISKRCIRKKILSDCNGEKLCPCLFFFLSFSPFWGINTSIIKSFTFQNIFVLCQHFHTKVRFKLGETIPFWRHFYISDYHSSEERLSEGSEYQCWKYYIHTPVNPTPLALQPSSREWCSSLSVSERTEYSR